MGNGGLARHRGVIHERADQIRQQHRHDQRHGIRHHQADEALADLLGRMVEPGHALGREAGSGQIAAEHQKDLHGHARVLAEPIDGAG
ncbi:hypothetical protein SDC9_87199 [bioreactor metagenome]|uniref:Uncharacterized protein n=1 Tax=bioreactor metagenome TaxID=1076179 RepID=A0A644ZI36_9ZZZZ